MCACVYAGSGGKRRGNEGWGYLEDTEQRGNTAYSEGQQKDLMCKHRPDICCADLTASGVL